MFAAHQISRRTHWECFVSPPWIPLRTFRVQVRHFALDSPISSGSVAEKSLIFCPLKLLNDDFYYGFNLRKLYHQFLMYFYHVCIFILEKLTFLVFQTQCIPYTLTHYLNPGMMMSQQYPRGYQYTNVQPMARGKSFLLKYTIMKNCFAIILHIGIMS